MSSQLADLRRPTGWIISLPADLILLIASPLLIVPLVGLAAQRFSAEAIFLAVAAFASIGHHLPGFLRAYGDRELFRRFRWRFLLAPPLIFAVALVFAWQQLHGLELILLVWATWHIMMQTYGLMRIYDLKRGVRDRASARLDLAACVAVFAAGILFSQTRMFMIFEAMDRVRIPLAGVIAAPVARWGIAVVAVALLVAYVVHTHLATRQIGPSWAKLGLLAATGWLYWMCGSIGANLLIGVAIFEIFHALQYYAIVWSYNRRLRRSDAARLGLLQSLFADGWLPLAVYCGAIVGFGSIKLLSNHLDPSLAKTWLLTLLLTSTALHFYFDGFIWKVGEAGTRQNLGIDNSGAERRGASGFGHGVRCAAIAAIVAVLFCSERWGAPPNNSLERDWLAVATTWAPDAPELLLRKCYFSLKTADSASALAAATALTKGHPASAENQLLLARSYVASRNFPAADIAARRAVQLDPSSGNANFQLGLVSVQLGNLELAESSLLRARHANPDSAATNLQLGNVFFLTGRYESAVRSYRQCAATGPDSGECQGNLGAALLGLGRKDEAKTALTAALTTGDNPQVHYNLALLLLSGGDADGARLHLQQAEKSGQAVPVEIRKAAGMPYAVDN